jgi:hypothetical protein
MAEKRAMQRVANSVLIMCLVASCGGNRERIDDVSTVKPREGVQLHANSDVRFGVHRQQAHTHDHGPAKTEKPQGKIGWETPAGWHAQPSSAMRVANFTAGPDGAVECYLTVLRGVAGGVPANINRWRVQLGLEPEPPDGLTGTTPVQVLGHESVLVTLRGEGEGARTILGMICPRERDVIFVKMIGPGEAVVAESAAFRSFVESLRLEGGNHEH